MHHTRQKSLPSYNRYEQSPSKGQLSARFDYDGRTSNSILTTMEPSSTIQTQCNTENDILHTMQPSNHGLGREYMKVMDLLRQRDDECNYKAVLLQNKLSQLEKENRYLRKKLAYCKEENKDLNERLALYQKELREKDALIKNEIMNNDVKMELGILKGQNESLKELLQQIHKDNDSLLLSKDQEIRRLEEQLSLCEAKMREMAPISVVETLKTTYNAHILDLTKRLDEDRERAAEEKAKICLENSQLTVQLKSLEELNSRMTNEQNRFKEQIARYQAEKEKTDQFIEELQGNLYKAECQASQVNELNKLSAEKISKLEKDIENLQNKMTTVEAESREVINVTSQRLQQQATEHEAALAQKDTAHQEELEKKSLELEGLKQQIVVFESAKKDQELLLEKLESLLKEAQCEIERRDQAHEVKQKELRDMITAKELEVARIKGETQAQLEKLEEANIAAAAEMQKAHQVRVDKLIQELEVLEKEFTETHKKHSALKQEAEQTKRNAQELEKEKRLLKAANDKLERELKDFEHSFNLSKINVQELEKEKRLLKAVNEKLERELKDFEHSFNLSKIKENELNNQIGALDAQLQDCHKRIKLLNESRHKEELLTDRSRREKSPLRELSPNINPSVQISPIHSARTHYINSQNNSMINLYGENVGGGLLKNSAVDAYKTSTFARENIPEEPLRESELSQTAYQRLSEKYLQIKNLLNNDKY